MSLQSAIQAVAKAAFKPVSSLLVSVTYQSVADQVDDYSPSAGTVLSTTEDYEIDVLMTDISSGEFEFNSKLRLLRDQDPNLLLNTTKKVLVPGLNLDATPKAGDKVLIDEVLWDVFSVETDPASALWSIYIRQP